MSMSIRANLLGLSFFIAIAIAVAYFLNKEKGETMDKFEWLPTECAPTNYPMRIVNGVLDSSRGGRVNIPASARISNGWGSDGSTHIVGERYKVVPNSVAVTWLSYTENKFYSGRFPLPEGQIETLMRQRITDKLGEEAPAFNRILVGLAPGGFLAVWARGLHVTTEIATFKAAEAQTEWRVINDNPDINRANYVAMVLKDELTESGFESLKAKGVPLGLWESYHVRYEWKPVIVCAESVFELRMSFFNGEREAYYNHAVKAVASKRRAALSYIYIRWAKLHGARNVTFEAEEVMQAMLRLNAEAPSAELQFQIELLGPQHQPKVSISNGRSVVHLSKIVSQMLPP